LPQIGGAVSLHRDGAAAVPSLTGDLKLMDNPNTPADFCGDATCGCYRHGRRSSAKLLAELQRSVDQLFEVSAWIMDPFDPDLTGDDPPRLE